MKIKRNEYKVIPKEKAEKTFEKMVRQRKLKSERQTYQREAYTNG